MSLYDCLKCGKKVSNIHQKWFAIPHDIWVPANYFLCDEHKNLEYKFEDIYNKDGTRKK